MFTSKIIHHRQNHFTMFSISVVIRSSGGLSKDQIENMIREAEKNAAADAERKEKVEVCNQAESVIQDTDSKLTEFKDQVDAKEVISDICHRFAFLSVLFYILSAVSAII